ncbi:hypothetical protein FOMPIDRAFT_86757 [Fomitopsis schrenkii]|uniref:Uncharacterized protein n=1 Tax=Fomitopsis schrenkii TaxID=2126942 RepID=S8ES79_FOMSC|nr:hypothetical protein FOMPIDRAFT_86757 [Fomitopsis schrenkii]
MTTDPGKSSASILDPPPPSFLRSPRPDLPYSPFEPTSLSSLSDGLGQGFPQLPPQSRDVPHPFVTHDVSEEDWRIFLFTVKSASAHFDAAISSAGNRRVGLLGTLVSMGIEQATKGKKAGAVGDLVDQWNLNFFLRRQMTVVLARGKTAYNGSAGAGPHDMTTNPVDGKWRLIIAYRPTERGF